MANHQGQDIMQKIIPQTPSASHEASQSGWHSCGLSLGICLGLCCRQHGGVILNGCLSGGKHACIELNTISDPIQQTHLCGSACSSGGPHEKHFTIPEPLRRLSRAYKSGAIISSSAWHSQLTCNVTWKGSFELASIDLLAEPVLLIRPLTVAGTHVAYLLGFV